MKKEYLALVLLLIFVAFAASYNNLTALDELGHRLLFGNTFLKSFSWFGNTSTVVVLTIIIAVWRLVIRNWQGAVLVVVSVAGATGINQLLKRAFERPRPEMVDQLQSFTFPSGHSMMSVGYLLVLGYLVAQSLAKRSTKRVVYGLVLLLIACIGLSRIAYGHHYVTDILAGWSLAGAWVIGCIILYEKKIRE